MKDRESVTTNGRAAFYAAMWGDLKNAALDCGWALGLHGSLNSDMDIMAMPWTEKATTVEVMLQTLEKCLTIPDKFCGGIKKSTDKPNNRIVYSLSIWADFYLDINIIYATQSNQANGGEGKGVLESLKEVSDFYFHKKDYISAGQINRAIDIVGEYLTTLPSTPSIPLSKKFSVEDVRRAMYVAIQDVLNVHDPREDTEVVEDYIKTLTPQSHQPEVKDSWDEILNKFHASNNSDESGYMIIEWLKENYNTPFQSSTKTK